MIRFEQKGDFSKSLKFLERALEVVHLGQLDKYGREGVTALSAATPEDTGDTAKSWYYEIKRGKDSVTIVWCNNSMDNDGDTPIAILLQYGHGTRQGAYVEGVDYINPAMRPVFNRIAEHMWKEVTGQ